MKVGIITIYTEPNYGSALQAYATQIVIQNLGHECQIIRYKYPNEWNYKQGYPRSSFFRLFIRSLGLKKYHKKANRLKRFVLENFNLTREFKSLDELQAYDWTSNFDVVASGSDQVWNYRYLYGESAFMLSFLPDDFKRISIASSFACKEITTQYFDKYLKYLSKYNALSVRENNGKNILEKQLKITDNAKVLLDPTLLLSREQWLSTIKEKAVARLKGKKYILLYGLYYAFEPRPYIFEVLSYFKEKYLCEVVALEGYMKPSECNNLEMIDCTDSTVNEFIYLFNHAELVVTSSFHGTAFGLNFSRPLISIVPDNGIDDRLSSLLKNVGAESSLVEVGSKIDLINPNYNFQYSSSKLDYQRNDCISWIKQALYL